MTSSPTPGYVARVAAVFKDNGTGVRGDLAAVTRAILLDPEARGARKIDPEYGRLREPALLWTAMIRGLDVTTDGERPQGMGVQSNQPLFQAPTVFNYYPADFTLSGSTIPGLNTASSRRTSFSTARTRSTTHSTTLMSHGRGRDPFGAGGRRDLYRTRSAHSSPTLAAFLPDASNADALVERINRLFLHGTMKADMRQTIVNGEQACADRCAAPCQFRPST